MTMDTTTTEGATEVQGERTWCRSVSVAEEALYFYIHRPSDDRQEFAVSLHGPSGLSVAFHPSEALLRELHRVIGDALFGEPDERDTTEEAT
jgi:hypothetical protein